jgi:phosphonate transport system substrate-binding protein
MRALILSLLVLPAPAALSAPSPLGLSSAVPSPAAPSPPRLQSAPPRQTIKFAVTDIVGLEQLQSDYGKFVEVLQRATGFTVEFYPVTSRPAAAEALKYKRVDFVLGGPAEYVVMKKRADARPVVAFSRPDYFAQVIVKADSDVQEAKDLKGKKVAFSTVGSTSGHLGPMQLLADYGIDPQKDIEAVHLLAPVGLEALKRGDVAALGLGTEKFALVREADEKRGGPPAGAYRVILRGRDFPNDVLMAGPHVDDATIAAVRKAFVEQSDEMVAAVMVGATTKKKYGGGMRFLPAVKDSDYDYVRKMYKTAGYPEYSEFLEK